MRTIGSGNAAQPTGDVIPRVEVENNLGALVDQSAYVVSVEYDETTDEIANGCTVVFRRGAGVSSLAPLMTADRPVDVGRDLVVSIDPGSGTYKEVFRGRIDAVEWPQRFGDMMVHCRDQAGVIADTWIETVRGYGTSAGVPLETVMQSVATDNLASAPTIYVPTATSAVVALDSEGKQFSPAIEPVLTAERALAESIGWTLRWRYIDSLSAWRWTLFEPSRTKTVADHTFATSAYYDVTVMSQEITDIRNVVEVEYSNAGESGTPRRTVKVEDATSIAAYGRRYIKIAEKSDSAIRDSTTATALANAALSDLKDPDALLEITCRYFWPGELGVDLYTFTANDVHFTSDQTLAPVAFRHRLALGERPTTKILCRGKPSGGVLMWRRKAAQSPVVSAGVTEPESVYSLNNFTRRDTATQSVFTWTRGSKVDEVWVWDTSYTAGSVPADPWPNDSSDLSTVNVLEVGTDTYTATIPAFGAIRYIQFEARKSDLTFGPGSNTVKRVIVMPNQVGTEGIADQAVLAAKLATAAVEREKILDGAISDLKLAALAVTEAKLAAAAVTTTKISDNAVTTPKIIAGAIQTSHMDAGSINADRLIAASITADQIATNAVTADKISAGAVTAGKISVSSLSAIAADIGQVTAGYIRNSANTAGIAVGNVGADTVNWTRYLSFYPSDTYFIYSPQFNVTTGGNATFAGSLSSASGSMQSLTMNGPVAMNFSEAITFNYGVLNSPGPALYPTSASRLYCDEGFDAVSLYIGGSQVLIGAAGTGPGGSGRALYLA